MHYKIPAHYIILLWSYLQNTNIKVIFLRCMPNFLFISEFTLQNINNSFPFILLISNVQIHYLCILHINVQIILA